MTHEHHDHRPVHLDESDWRAWADHATLEGEVLLAFVTGAATRVAALRGDGAPPVRRVLDVGAGPGVGTCELARIFPEAEVIAVDASPAMLERAEQRAAGLGLGDRVRTHLAELPGGLDAVGPADVIWASMSLHHVGDEVAALRVLGAALAPGGLLAVVEMGDPLRVLPDDLDVGRPGLADRLDRVGAAWFSAMRAGLPGTVPSADLPAMIHDAGLDVVAADTVTEHQGAPLGAGARRLALEHLRRTQERFTAEELDGDDVSALATLTDPDDPRGAARRADLILRTSRQVVIARRRT